MNRFAAAAAVLLAACAAPKPAIPLIILPGLEKRVDPVLPPQASILDPTERAPAPLFPTPDGRLVTFGGRLSVDLPRGWKAPVEAPGGVALVDGEGRAGAGAAFHPEGSPEWEDPADFKRRLRTLGAVEDSPLFEPVTLGGRYGVRRRWTTHKYKGPWTKLGGDAEVFLTETILVPDQAGIYVLWFRAPKGEFVPRRAGFAELLRSLRLSPPGPDAWRPSAKERRLAVPAWD